MLTKSTCTKQFSTFNVDTYLRKAEVELSVEKTNLERNDKIDLFHAQSLSFLGAELNNIKTLNGKLKVWQFQNCYA